VSEIDWASLRKTAEDGTRPLDDGDYGFVIDSASATFASTGSEMIKATLRVTTGPQAGRKLWTNFVVSPDSAWALKIFFSNMAALGLNDAYFAGKPSMEKIAADLVGRGGVATVGTREFQGSERNEVKNIKNGVGGTSILGIGGGGPSVPSMGPSSSPAPVMTPSVPSTPSTPPPPPPVAPTDASF